METIWVLLAGYVLGLPLALAVAVVVLWRRVERLSQRPERASPPQPTRAPLPRHLAWAPWMEEPKAGEASSAEVAEQVAPAAPAAPLGSAVAAAPLEPAATSLEPALEPAPEPSAAAEAALPTPPAAIPPARTPRARTPKASPTIAWERWVGVRGAGLLGGIAAALAGVLLFRHAMEVGWITPRLRVLTGLVGGALLIGIGEWLRPRNYRAVPEALVGAGAVAIYAALWAASQLYAMWSVAVSFPAMAALTALLCYAAVRRASAGAAVFALIGGFATPLLLATGEDPGAPHFAYLLVLNVALGFVAQRLSRAWLGLLAVCATVVMQVLWFERHFEADELRFALGMLALFGILAAAAPRRGEREHMGAGVVARWIGLTAPFGFALFLAGRVDLGPNPWPYVLFVLPLLAAAAFLARQRGMELLVSLTSMASLALLLALIGQPAAKTALPVALVLAAPLFAAVVHVFLELAHLGPGRVALAGAPGAPRRDFAHPRALATAQWILLGGAVAAPLALQFGDRPPALPLLLAGSVVALLLAVRTQAVLLRLGCPGSHGASFLALGAFGVLPVAFGWNDEAGRASDALPAGPLWLKAFGFAAPTLLWSLLTLRGALRGDGPRGAAAPSMGAFGSALLALPLGATAVWFAPDFDHMAWAGLTAVLLCGWALAAAVWNRRSSAPAWFALAAAVVTHAVLANTEYVEVRQPFGPWSGQPGAYFGVLGGLAFGLAFAVVRGRAAAERPSVGWSAALQLIAAFSFALPAASLVAWRFGQALLALGFAALAAVLVALVPKERVRPRGHVASAAVLFAAAGGALAIDREVWLLGLAFAALGLGALWRLLRTASPAWLGSGAAVLASLMLLRVSLVGDYWPRTATPLLHTAGAVHLAVIAGCLALAAALAPLLRAPSPLRFAPQLAAGAGALATFVAVSLAVIDIFGTGPNLWLPAQRDAKLDLFLSLAWAAYALVLLVLGLLRRAAGPRWASLVILLVVILKVFLRDLGHLDGLARVGSLAGLAVSLTLVSLLYQRYVFRRTPEAAAAA